MDIKGWPFIWINPTHLRVYYACNNKNECVICKTETTRWKTKDRVPVCVFCQGVRDEDL